MIKEYLSDHARVGIDENGVIQSIKSDPHFNTNLSDTIQNYVLDELVYFRNKNHISKRAWKKRGIIELDTKELGYFSYFLVYETRFKKRYHKIKFSNLVLKQAY